ncbi:uncharacterized protein LOC105701225 isoform X2 [Orussus abietinus]|nr:uncharacterized protein LOC105701225 isoform X2 [Orussus abietinus]
MEHTGEITHLTLDMVRQLIATNESDVEITNLQEEPGSGRGDNYTSMLYRIRAKGVKHLKTGESVPCERSIIYKVLPQSRERREAYKSEVLFRNEVAFYTHVWPALDKLQVGGKSVFKGVAKIYIARDNLIAMEDLRERGFQMVDRRKGLELDNLKLVLKALAGFHALSLTLRELRPEEFEGLSKKGGDGVEETLFRMENEDWYRQYYRVAANNAIAMVSGELAVRMESNKEEVIQKLKDFLNENTFFRTMSELAAAQGPLTVFCHGDCWTNNILFRDPRASSTDTLEDVYLVDFQISRASSLALDLVNLLYCCTTGKVRQDNMIQLLKHYHSYLMSALQTLDPKEPPRDPSALWKV